MVDKLQKFCMNYEMSSMVYSKDKNGMGDGNKDDLEMMHQ
jgi:hypothetical protein